MKARRMAAALAAILAVVGLVVASSFAAHTAGPVPIKSSKTLGQTRGRIPASPAPPPTHASLLIGPSWFAVLVTTAPQAKAPATYGLALSPETAVQVPGYGSLTLEQAQASGGRPLAASAVSGLLGIALDRSVVVSDPFRHRFSAAPPMTGSPSVPRPRRSRHWCPPTWRVPG